MLRLSRTTWIVIGIVLGAIAVPGLAVAATVTLVNVRGNDHTAYVTPANQLRTAAADPADHRFASVGSGGACSDLGALGGTNGLVVTHANINIQGVDGTGSALGVLTTGASCGGTPIAVASATEVGPHDYDLEPGVALKAGTHLSFQVFEGGGNVGVSAYVVRSAAVPAAAATVHSFGPAPGRAH